MSKLKLKLEKDDLMNSEGGPRFQSTTAVRTLVVVLAKLRHEFRTHLNAIIGSSELALEDCQTPACQRLIPNLRKVQLSGQHMLKLVNTLLDPSELETRTSDQALQQCASQTRRQLGPPIETIIKSSEALLKDTAELDRQNLLDDAQNISAAGAKLIALLDRLALLIPDDHSEAEQFESPALFSKTTSLSFRKLGVTAALRPLSKEEIEVAASEQGHLLIVDSDTINRDLLARRLSRFGHSVEVAESGRQALEMMRAQSFDLVLLDILMPEMNGYQLLEQIQADPSLREVPVIVVSSLHEVDSVARAVALGAADYMPKPINSVLLRARVNACLEKKRLRDQEVFHLRELERLNRDLELRNEFIQRTFGRYTSDELVERLLKTPEGLKLGGELRRVTILMSDVRGFTALSERLAPEQIVTLLNTYLGAMAEVIIKHQGLIDEFIGDAILVIFGAPIEREDDARRAVACAIEMQLAMGAVNEQNRRAGLPEVAMGIGLNTGEVVAGNIGSLKRTKYGVIGPQVNLTSRIESFTVGGQILISEATREAVGDILRIDSQISVEPKGVERPITLYEIGGIGGQYNLFLPETSARLVSLRDEIKLQYWIIEEKQTQPLAREGAIIRLSQSGAELRLDSPIARFSNLKLRLFDLDGARMPGDLYAKVRGGEDETVYVSFTAVPPEVARLFNDALSQGR